jgi:hypothetical protein
MRKTLMFFLAGVASILRLGDEGGVFGWFTDHFKHLLPDGSTLARAKAAPATEDDDVVVLAQLNAATADLTDDVDQRLDAIMSSLPLIVSAVVNDVAALPDYTTIDTNKVYAVANATGITFHRNTGEAWEPVTPNESALITFVQDVTLAAELITIEAEDGTTTTTAQVYDNHIYVYESTTVLKDNGEATGLDTKLSVLREELVTKITEVAKGAVKKQYLAFDFGGLTGATFDNEIPDNAIVTGFRVLIETPFDTKFTTATIENNAVSLLASKAVDFKNEGIYVAGVLHKVTGAFAINFNGGTPTTGTGLIEITYALPWIV